MARSVSRPTVGNRITPNGQETIAQQQTQQQQTAAQKAQAIQQQSGHVNGNFSPTPSLYFQTTQTANGPVTVKYQNTNSATFQGYRPVGITQNTVFSVPINQTSGGFTTTGTATYTYALQGSQLTPVLTNETGTVTYNGTPVASLTPSGPVAIKGATVTQTLSEVIAGQNQQVGTVTYVPSISGQNVSLAFSSFQSNAVYATYPAYVQNPVTGQVYKVGVSVQAFPTYNAATGQISVNFPPATGLSGYLYSSPQTATVTVGGTQQSVNYNVALSGGQSTAQLLSFNAPGGTTSKTIDITTGNTTAEYSIQNGNVVNTQTTQVLSLSGVTTKAYIVTTYNAAGAGTSTLYNASASTQTSSGSLGLSGSNIVYTPSVSYVSGAGNAGIPAAFTNAGTASTSYTITQNTEQNQIPSRTLSQGGTSPYTITSTTNAPLSVAFAAPKQYQGVDITGANLTPSPSTVTFRGNTNLSGPSGQDITNYILGTTLGLPSPTGTVAGKPGTLFNYEGQVAQFVYGIGYSAVAIPVSAYASGIAKGQQIGYQPVSIGKGPLGSFVNLGYSFAIEPSQTVAGLQAGAAFTGETLFGLAAAAVTFGIPSSIQTIQSQGLERGTETIAASFLIFAPVVIGVKAIVEPEANIKILPNQNPDVFIFNAGKIGNEESELVFLKANTNEEIVLPKEFEGGGPSQLVAGSLATNVGKGEAYIGRFPLETNKQGVQVLQLAKVDYESITGNPSQTELTSIFEGVANRETYTVRGANTPSATETLVKGSPTIEPSGKGIATSAIGPNKEQIVTAQSQVVSPIGNQALSEELTGVNEQGNIETVIKPFDLKTRNTFVAQSLSTGEGFNIERVPEVQGEFFFGKGQQVVNAKYEIAEPNIFLKQVEILPEKQDVINQIIGKKTITEPAKPVAPKAALPPKTLGQVLGEGYGIKQEPPIPPDLTPPSASTLPDIDTALKSQPNANKGISGVPSNNAGGQLTSQINDVYQGTPRVQRGSSQVPIYNFPNPPSLINKGTPLASLLFGSPGITGTKGPSTIFKTGNSQKTGPSVNSIVRQSNITGRSTITKQFSNVSQRTEVTQKQGESQKQGPIQEPGVTLKPGITLKTGITQKNAQINASKQVTQQLQPGRVTTTIPNPPNFGGITLHPPTLGGGRKPKITKKSTAQYGVPGLKLRYNPDVTSISLGIKAGNKRLRNIAGKIGVFRPL
jgi:hypothetical protein